MMRWSLRLGSSVWLVCSHFGISTYPGLGNRKNIRRRDRTVKTALHLGGSLLLRIFTNYFFFVLLMYSSSLADLEAFERLGLNDMPPTTRQQEREGRNRYEISYHVNFITDHGEPSYITHIYELDFRPPTPLWDAIVEQGKNISHVVQVERAPGGYQQEPHFLIELQEKVTVSVYDIDPRRDNTRRPLQCDCSHQTNNRACKVSTKYPLISSLDVYSMISLACQFRS